MGIETVLIRVSHAPYYHGAFVLLVFLVGGFLYHRRNNLEFLYIKQTLAIVAVFFCCAMVSGQVWNRMRRPPFFHKSNNGPVYINGIKRSQYVLESYIVAILNGVVVVGFILMIEATGGVRSTETTRTIGKGMRQFQWAVGLVLVCVFFSILLSVYRTKSRVYPYRFLFE